MNEIKDLKEEEHGKLILALSMLLLIFLVIASFSGIFIEATYARNTPSFAAQGIGQDIVNLFIVTPLLLISSILYYKGNIKGKFVWAGLIVYILYSYVIYGFAQPFNFLFLVYCAVLGLAFYAFIYFLLTTYHEPIKDYYQSEFPSKAVILFNLIVALLFYFVWLSEVVPALIANRIPQSVIENGVNTNPVHVLDLSIVLPALLITAFWLFKDHKNGYFMAPVLLIFLLIMALAIIAMIIAMEFLGVATDFSLTVIFGVITGVDAIITAMVFKSLKSR